MRSSYSIIFVILAIAMVVGSLGIWQLSKSRNFQFFGGLVSRVNTTERIVVLTFDDGPAEEFTDDLLAILCRYRIRATFFVTGAELKKRLAQGRRIVEKGHELGNHSYSHKRMIFRSLSFMRNEIERTDELIRQVGYKGPIHFRPPYGKKLLVLPYYLKKTGRKTILWDVEVESFPEVMTNSDRIVKHILTYTQPGSIILLHAMYSEKNETRRAIPRVIEGLQRLGYRFVTVSELLESHGNSHQRLRF